MAESAVVLRRRIRRIQSSEFLWSQFWAFALLLLLFSGVHCFSVGPNQQTVPSGAADWLTNYFTTNDDDSRRQQLQQSLSLPPQRVVGPEHVLIYDTSLRDGTQGESVSASVNDKFKICRRLAAFDVDYIEAGWPGSNPKDREFFERAKTELSPPELSKLAAFGSTRRKGTPVAEDPQVMALIDSVAPTVCIVAKSHAWQVTEIIRATLDENLEMIAETVSFLKQHGRNVMVDLEHFFDGYQSNRDYTLQCCVSAAKAGASCLVLCDTNGGSMPWQIQSAVHDLMGCSELEPYRNSITLGIHCHNDCGMAVANSVVAIQSGVGLVQGTINGIGERTGNADLCSIIPTLALKGETTQLSCRGKLKELTSLSRYVDEILNRTPNHAAPYVGASAFAHKGGLHVAAMKRSPMSYQHADPSDIGNESRVLISELSGRQNILGKVRAMQVAINSEDDEADVVASDRAAAILKRVKQLEAQGYTFEGAEASVDLMILHASKGYCPPFQVLDYSAQVYDSNMDSASRYWFRNDQDDEKICKASGVGPTARATVKVRTVETGDKTKVDGSSEEDELDGEVSDGTDTVAVVHERLEVSDGNGPVDALAKALMRALQPVHPSLKDVELVDYKVRILDPESATGAATRVMIEFRDLQKETTWTTVSVDTNVISASFNALIDGFEYALIDYSADNCVILDHKDSD